jgi:hypothetical protein
MVALGKGFDIAGWSKSRLCERPQALLACPDSPQAAGLGSGALERIVEAPIACAVASCGLFGALAPEGGVQSWCRCNQGLPLRTLRERSLPYGRLDARRLHVAAHAAEARTGSH